MAMGRKIFEKIISQSYPKERNLMLILALDPGETTGYVIAEADGLDYDIKVSGQFPNWQLFDSLIRSYSPNTIVYEAFYLSPEIAKFKSRSTLPTVEVIGVLKYLAPKYSVRQLVAQPPSAKELVSLPRYIAGVSGPHARDALKHLIAYLRGRNADS